MKTEFSNVTLIDLNDPTMNKKTKDKRKELRAGFRTDMKQMNNELDVVHERFGEEGLDALFD